MHLIKFFLCLGLFIPQAVSSDVTNNHRDYSSTSICFVGDSITYGTRTTKTYVEYLNESHAFGSYSIVATPGCCVSVSSDYAQKNNPLAVNYTNVPCTDIITIFLGTNDYGHESDLYNDDPNSNCFHNDYVTAISYLLENNPDSTIILIGPTHRYGFGTSKILQTNFTYDYLPNGKGYTLQDYSNEIKSIAETYHLPFINGLNIQDLNPDSEQWSSLTGDGLHPNKDGHLLIANEISCFLDYLPAFNYCKEFNRLINCDASGETLLDVENWNTFSSSYSSLDSAQQEYLRAMMTSQIDSQQKEMLDFAEKYLYIINKYDYLNDFIGGLRSLDLFSFVYLSSQNQYALIVLLALAIGGLLVVIIIRIKKENDSNKA